MFKDDYAPGTYCPYSQKRCRKEECALYVVLTGDNPNTGQPMLEGKCSHHWQVILAVEGNKNSYQVGAAVESFRNEMVKENRRGRLLLAKLAQGEDCRISAEVNEASALGE